MRFETETSGDDVLTIDTGSYGATITRAGVDYDDIICPDFGSEYLKLQPGINDIKVGFGYSGEGTEVSIEYSLRFAGV